MTYYIQSLESVLKIRFKLTAQRQHNQFVIQITIRSELTIAS